MMEENRMTAVLLAACLAGMAYVAAKAWRRLDFVKMMVIAVCGFFMLYTVVGGLFFWADCFAFEAALAACLAVEGLAAAFLIRHSPGTLSEKLAWRVTFDWRCSIIPVVIALAALPFVWQKFDLYSMGQDQGTYQVKALYLMEYDTHNYMELEEFQKLDTPEERQKYLDFVYGQNNFYLPRVEWETETDASHFETIRGTIHGLPTYSALLALWGRIFGYARMIGVQTWLYLALLFAAYYTCVNLRLKKVTAALVTALTAFSPIVIWLSKSSLTEVGIALLIASFLYLLTEPQGERRPWLCMLPIVAFSFFHISLYAFMPLFVLVLFLLYLADWNKGWLVAITGSACGWGIGSLWALSIAPYYAYGNYSELFRVSGGLISEERLIPVIVGICLLATVLCALLSYEKLLQALKMLAASLAAERKKWEKAGFLLLRLFLLLSLAFFVYKGVLTAETETACEYLQISTYIYMSGLFLVPFLYLVLFFRPGLAFGNRLSAALTLCFLYGVVMYSMVMRVRILFYYYFARYAALFLLVIFLLAALILEQCHRRVLIGLLGLSLLTFVPYVKGFVVQKDHSRCEWEFLADVCEDIGPGDAFVVGPDEQQIVFIFPVKALTGCDVYYADEQLDAQLAGLAESYEHVYYMDYDRVFEDTWGNSGALENTSVTKVYTNWNHLSYLDYFNITNPLTPIPLNYVEYRLKLSLYELEAR